MGRRGRGGRGLGRGNAWGAPRRTLATPPEDEPLEASPAQAPDASTADMADQPAKEPSDLQVLKQQLQVLQDQTGRIQKRIDQLETSE